MVLEYVQTKCTRKIICCFWRQKCTAIVKKQENFTTEETETITPTSSLNFFKTEEKNPGLNIVYKIWGIFGLFCFVWLLY